MSMPVLVEISNNTPPAPQNFSASRILGEALAAPCGLMRQAR
jgi:hypothetical protein